MEEKKKDLAFQLGMFGAAQEVSQEKGEALRKTARAEKQAALYVQSL